MNTLIKASSLAIITVLFSGCATPSKAELDLKTNIEAIDKTQCAQEISNLKTDGFATLVYDERVAVNVNDESQCLLINDQPTYLAGFKLPEFSDKGYGLQLESRLVKTVMLFLPDAYLLDKDMNIVREITADQYKYRSSKWETTAFVNSDELGAQYLVFFTNPEKVGDGEKRRIVDTSTTYLGTGGYITTGVDNEKSIYYTTQGTLVVTATKN